MSQCNAIIQSFILSTALLLGFAPLALAQNAPADQPQTFTNSIGIKFVLIPAGKFTMGSPETEVCWGDTHKADELQHPMEISRPFYMSQYEVTQHQYELVMGTNPSGFSSTGRVSDSVKGVDTSNYPVETVSWYDAVLFCNLLSEKEGLTPVYTLTNVISLQKKVATRNIYKTLDKGEIPLGVIDEAEVTISATANGYRLPTEAQWEYACRAGTSTPFHFGKSLNGDQANGNNGKPYGTTEPGKRTFRPAPVGSYAPNAFGLYDMHGNVTEWCQDVYGESYYKQSPSRDATGPEPDGPQSKRIARGGSYTQFFAAHRSAYRDPYRPGNPMSFQGIRLVLNR